MADSLSSDLASLRLNRDEPPPEGGRGKAIVIGALVLGGCVGAYFLGYPYVEASLFKTEVSATEISVLSPAQASVDLTSTGYVVAQLSSKVGAKIPGRIAKVLVKEGDQVKEGQLLATLEDTEQKSIVSTARARLAASRARAQAARANLAEADLRANRDRGLAQRGALALAQAQDSDARVVSLKESVKAADADTQAAETELSTATVNLQQLLVNSPMTGTILTKPLRAGEVVGPTVLTPILEIADFSSLVVETDVPEGRLGKVKKGAPCEIVLEAFPQRRLRGETLEIVPKVNRAKATAIVKVRFIDKIDEIGVLPDMAARVSFLSKALDDRSLKDPPKVVVPKSAVTDRDAEKVVFVIDGDKVRKTKVTLGSPFGDGYELQAGPSPGTKVVANPPPLLADGRKIKERNE